MSSYPPGCEYVPDDYAEEPDFSCDLCNDEMIIDCPHCYGTGKKGGNEDNKDCPHCEEIAGQVPCPECS